MGRKKKARVDNPSTPMDMEGETVSTVSTPALEEGLQVRSHAGASASEIGTSSSKGKKKKSRFDALPGGCPMIPDTPLLKALGSHISMYCRVQQVKSLNLRESVHYLHRCAYHLRAFQIPVISGWRCSWGRALELYREASSDLKTELERAGFASFLSIPLSYSDRRLILAVCERWFGETNTFHFPCCELGLTPLDFVMLTGIRIEGKPIPAFHIMDPGLAAGLMGVSLETMVDDHAWDKKLKMTWLAESLRRDGFATIQSDSPGFEGLFRRLFLYILGECFFMNDHYSIKTSLLELMDPLDQIRSHDWGGCVYGSILWGLRRVSRGDGQSIRFFYPIIEMWAHEYLDSFHPSLKIPVDDAFPWSTRWKAPADKVDGHLFEKAREELDRLTLGRVTLHPFADLSDPILSLRGGAEGFLARRVVFSYRGSCEYFLGERVYHQYGEGFRIPHSPPVEMTPICTQDFLMEQMRTRGISAEPFSGELMDYSVYRVWLRSVSIGPIMRPISIRPGATEVGGLSTCGSFERRDCRPSSYCRESTVPYPFSSLRTLPTFDVILYFFQTRLRSLLTEFMPIKAIDHVAPVPPAFERLRLGTVASLFNVRINGHLAEAALGCWNPEFHVFRFGVFELCPKYGRLLSVPFDQDKIVIPFPRASWKGKAASFLGVKRGFLEKLDGEDYHRCSLEFLMDYFAPRNPSWIGTSSFMGTPDSWPQYRLRAMALAIVGHVLFPLSFNFIDMQVVEVVEQVMTGHSFIPILLAETFRALDRCVQKKGGFFKGCISLLQIWILEHLKFCNPLATPAFMRQDLIKSHCSFSNIPPFLDSPESWYDQLITLAPDVLVWKCSWLHVVEVISGTSGRNHLILIGLRGSSQYFPNRVVRQFGRTQGIPVIEAITDVVDFGPSSEKLLSHLLVGWRSRVKSTFGDDQESLVTGEYVRWLTDCCIPYVPPPHPSVGEKRKEPMSTVLIEDQPNYKELEERITSLLAENAGLKAEVAKMGVEAAAYQDCIRDLRAQVNVLGAVNEEFQYFQNPIGGKKSSSQEVILKLNAELARLHHKLKDQGGASSDSD
ncbi:hypothetical protein HHK36_025933 [Tetracentron sinense]|uniref:Aminotransferase-like plant mobile domain-containing protein n=1 Tax=Tetracentron sinense TaxID=13715 RepID=A0A834YJP4_TETSI|nr:hypothetical protein HHK36_025933 [Tetracentron sinense]